jgi:hypothetical protein
MKRYLVQFWVNKSFLRHTVVEAKNKRTAERLARDETGLLSKNEYKTTISEV